MAVLIASYLLLVFLVPIVLSAVVSYRALRRSVDCPVCAGDTLMVRRPWLRILCRVAPRIRLQRRWCMRCGWEGLTRAEPRPAPAPVETATRAQRPTALDLRSLRLDGRTWRVQLQTWRDVQRCYGRLVFIEPSGRPWADGVQSFSGATPFEVLGQALSVPDRTMTSRLRQLLIAES